MTTNKETVTASAFAIGEIQSDDTLEEIGARGGDLFILMKNTKANIEISKKLFLNES